MTSAIGMRDEALFHLSGCVNKQNFRYWSDVNSRQLHESPLHSEHVTVGSFGVIGPYFSGEDRHAVTVNSGRCVHMLYNFLAPEINIYGINQQTMWFKQDRATAHIARASMAVVQEMFPGDLISQRGDLPWPAQSPDLSVCDYFLWDHLKAKYSSIDHVQFMK
jgi:hypothetical protein